MYDSLKTIKHKIDADGFVLVRGKRVLNVAGKMLRARPSDTCTCQLCGGRVPMPMRVVSEFEHAIGARRYFHVPPVGAFNEYRLCGACKEAA